ncbi:MAG: hypothetical protein GY833_22365 [Aestuariibacter sp.]|nr:hypothetical protein [Aestuariibacter sp.]|tara:strand:- start:269 stop:634 length:366 start_codon:yes stop_codon:yes gene_type:complete
MTDMTMNAGTIPISSPQATPRRAVAFVQPLTEASVRYAIKVTEFKLVAYSLVKFMLICAFLAAGYDVAAAYKGFSTFYFTQSMATVVLIVSAVAFTGFQFVTTQLENLLENHYDDLEQFED